MFIIDALLMGNYPKIAFDNFPSDIGVGVIWRVDGIKDCERGLGKLLARGDVPVCKIHLMWKDKHDFKKSDIAETVLRATEVAKFVEKFPAVQFYVCPWLENNVTGDLIKEVFAKIREVLPAQVKYINSGPAKIKNCIREIHHSTKALSGDYSFSFDGLSCLDADVEDFKNIHESATLFAIWDFVLNCKYSSKDQTKNRADRKLKPESRHFKSFAMMCKPKGATSLPADWLYKAYSDPEAVGSDHSKPLSRSWKPVFLVMGANSGSIELKVKGQVIAKFDYTNDYSDGRGIFRCNDWGCDIAEKAIALSKKPLCNVWLNGKKIGVINPVYRENSYKNKAE